MRPLRISLIGIALSLLIGCQILAPSSPPTDAQRVQAAEGESAAWEIAAKATAADAVQAYLERFPDGAHAASAQLRLKLIQKGTIK